MKPTLMSQIRERNSDGYLLLNQAVPEDIITKRLCNYETILFVYDNLSCFLLFSSKQILIF